MLVHHLICLIQLSLMKRVYKQSGGYLTSMKGKQLKRRQRQEELLKEFKQTTDHYEEKKIGYSWYIKSWNGGTGNWQVAIYPEESYRKYKSFTNANNHHYKKI